MRQVCERQFLIGLGGFATLLTVDHLRVSLAWNTTPEIVFLWFFWAMLPAFYLTNTMLFARLAFDHRQVACIGVSVVSWLIWVTLETFIWFNL